MDTRVLRDEILNTGNQLVDRGSDAGPSLRELQGHLYQLKVADPHIIFLGFFIFSLIDDLYFNLSGDLPYNQKLDTIIDRIFKEIGQLLLKLAHTLGSNKFEDFYDIYLDMVRVYLDGLTQIATITGQ